VWSSSRRSRIAPRPCRHHLSIGPKNRTPLQGSHPGIQEDLHEAQRLGIPCSRAPSGVPGPCAALSLACVRQSLVPLQGCSSCTQGLNRGSAQLALAAVVPMVVAAVVVACCCPPPWLNLGTSSMSLRSQTENGAGGAFSMSSRS
jgi:hypothetical protein